MSANYQNRADPIAELLVLLRTRVVSVDPVAVIEHFETRIAQLEQQLDEATATIKAMAFKEMRDE